MAVKRIISTMNVVEAAEKRIKNVFSNGVPVYLSFSGGKDSIVLANLVYQLIRKGEIDPSLLTVLFIDEEAIYDSVEKITMQWRKRFLAAGAKFEWWCIEVKHFSAYNQLTADESFICWDHTKEDRWVRRPPKFALRNHPQLLHGIDNYQSFMPKVTKDGIMMTGVRAYESVQRLQYMAAMNLGAGSSITGNNMIYPIYDWRTKDVWLYLKDNHIDIPIVYMWMYQAGIAKSQLRICQYFSIDCAGSLVHMAEYEPGLWERVIKREPNAYLAALYWDSELFRRNTKARTKQEEEKKDYKALTMHMLFEDPDKYFTTKLTKHVAESYRKLIVKTEGMARDRDYRKMYNALVGGDPKLRTMRAISMDIYTSYAVSARKHKYGGTK